jgi:predicted O-methyltransferase YrrM
MQTLDALWQELSSEPGFYPYSSEPEVGRFLGALIELVGAREVLELGTHRGATTMWLADAAARTGGRVTAVDVRDRVDSRVRARFANLRVVQSDSIPVLERFAAAGECFDLIFVDDLHTFEHVSAVLARLPQVTMPGGLWALHDVISFPGVARAIDEFARGHACERLTLTTPDVPGRPLERGLPSGLAILRPLPIGKLG